MKFGKVDLEEAEGAILAHSVALSSGRLRKGQVLSADDISAMAEAGMTEVIVARLAPGDIDENTAAARVAAALVPDPDAANLQITEAFTGRVNLLATGPGVVRLDAARLQALNRIDPMLTLATVPDYQQMSAGGMVATVKIISYAVPGSAVEAAESLLADAPSLRLERTRLRTARLIVTQIPGGAGEKGVKAIRDRVEALGMDLTETRTVAHDRAALAAELLKDAPEDLVLILTGSATSDPDDVAPGAVRDAGGQVTRFGMPVDPGNLLFLGDLSDRPVIGLPGCARSPSLNGADWILSRIACGLPVFGDDIAGMGVGGLLKEIPTRPQPRDRSRRLNKA